MAKKTDEVLNPSIGQIRELVILGGCDPDTGELVKSKFYLEPDGTEHIRALVNYGIGGIKVFDRPMADFKPPAAEKTLEDLGVPDLKVIAKDLGVAVSGRKVELIKRIRQAIEDKAKAELAAAEAAAEESEEAAAEDEGSKGSEKSEEAE